MELETDPTLLKELEALARDLFRRGDFAHAAQLFKLRRHIGPPEGSLVLLELVCRDAAGEPGIRPLLEPMLAQLGGR